MTTPPLTNCPWFRIWMVADGAVAEAACGAKPIVANPTITSSWTNRRNMTFPPTQRPAYDQTPRRWEGAVTPGAASRRPCRSLTSPDPCGADRADPPGAPAGAADT